MLSQATGVFHDRAPSFEQGRLYYSDRTTQKLNLVEPGNHPQDVEAVSYPELVDHFLEILHVTGIARVLRAPGADERWPYGFFFQFVEGMEDSCMIIAKKNWLQIIKNLSGKVYFS